VKVKSRFCPKATLSARHHQAKTVIGNEGPGKRRWGNGDECEGIKGPCS
jgi:hypothetical protein